MVRVINALVASTVSGWPRRRALTFFDHAPAFFGTLFNVARRSRFSPHPHFASSARSRGLQGRSFLHLCVGAELEAVRPTCPLTADRRYTRRAPRAVYTTDSRDQHIPRIIYNNRSENYGNALDVVRAGWHTDGGITATDGMTKLID